MLDESNVQDLPTSGIFKGIVKGDARVKRGSKLEVKGIIKGNLLIECGSVVLVSGIVKGKIFNDGSDIELTGIIGGNASS